MLKVGDFVRIVSLNNSGTVICVKARERRAVVCCKKNYTIECSFGEIEREAFPSEIIFQKVDSDLNKKSENFKKVYSEIDFHGYTKDEALEYLTWWIGESLFHGMKFATIIHGGGDGVIRKAIRDYCNKSPYVMVLHSQADIYGEGYTKVEFI